MLRHLNLGPSRRHYWQEESQGSEGERTVPKFSFEQIDHDIRNEGKQALDCAVLCESSALQVEVADRQVDIKELLAKAVVAERPQASCLSARLPIYGKYSAKLGDEYWQDRQYELSLDDLEEFKGYQQRVDG